MGGRMPVAFFRPAPERRGGVRLQRPRVGAATDEALIIPSFIRIRITACSSNRRFY
ncbi:hypothetical protein MASSI9I_51124 [Massilia sp. 9I]|nr:hypothetical protein MASSI9I_51124 [Massilia sp. 9I]